MEIQGYDLSEDFQDELSKCYCTAPQPTDEEIKPLNVHCYISNINAVGDKRGLVLESEVRKLEVKLKEQADEIERLKEFDEIFYLKCVEKKDKKIDSLSSLLDEAEKGYLSLLSNHSIRNFFKEIIPDLEAELKKLQERKI